MPFFEEATARRLADDVFELTLWPGWWRRLFGARSSHVMVAYLEATGNNPYSGWVKEDGSRCRVFEDLAIEKAQRQLAVQKKLEKYKGLDE